jgi:hypothetical protein
MKNPLSILLISFLCICFNSTSQSSWNTVYSPRGNFNFTFPAQHIQKDTLGLVSFIAVLSDSTISLQVNFIDSTAVYGNDEMQMFFSRRSNPATRNEFEDPIFDPESCYVDSIEIVLNNYAQMSQYLTQGSLEGYEPSDYFPCYIRGRELVIRHQNQSGNGEGYYYTFSRYFYWNSKFLCLSVSGPEELIWELYNYKNSLFNYIQIY